MHKRSSNISYIQMTEILQDLFPNQKWDDSAERSAIRLINALKEYTTPGDPWDDTCTLPFNFTTFKAKVNQMITIRDIEFSSLCMHHMWPFFGVVHVGYIPLSRIVGASKIPRLVDFVARRPQAQEYMTAQIASQLKHRLEAMGVAVIVEAHHTCMACRGVRKVGSSMTTSEMRGVFISNPAARDEFMTAVGYRRS